MSSDSTIKLLLSVCDPASDAAAVAVAVPIEAPELLDTLERAFHDNQNAWELDGEGHWRRLEPGPDEQPRSMQLELIEIHARRAAEERPGERERAGAGQH
jgi:hypothetical protein